MINSCEQNLKETQTKGDGIQVSSLSGFIFLALFLISFNLFKIKL